MPVHVRDRLETIILILLISISFPLRGNETLDLSRRIQAFDEQTFDTPERVVREATELYQEHSASMSPEEIVRLSVVIAESAGLYGRANTVSEWVQRGMSYLEQVDLPRERIRLHSLAGVSADFQGKSEEAQKFHKQAIELAVQSGSLEMEAYTRELYAYFANREENFIDVVQNVRRLEELFQVLPQNFTYHTSRAAVGGFFASKFYQRYDEGLALMKEAIDYFEAHGKAFLAFNYRNTVSIVLTEQTPEKGIAYGLDLIKRYPKTSDMDYPKYTYDSLGAAYLRLDRHAEALPYLKESAEFWKNNGDNKLYYAGVMLMVCQAYLGLGRIDDAEVCFLEIKDFAKDLSLSNRIDWLKFQADLLQKKGQTGEESKVLRQLIELSKTYREQQDTVQSKRMAALFDLERMEREKRELEMNNKLQSAEIQRMERTKKLLLALSLLSASLLLLALLYILKRREAAEKQRVLTEVLDTIEEGIVRIGPGGLILPAFSKATRGLLRLDGSLEGQELLPLLLERSHLSPDERQIARESLLSILDEDLVNWDINGVHLPQQITVHDRVLSLTWQPAVRAGKVIELILTIVDITRHLELEKTIAVERQRQEDFHVIVAELRKVSLQQSLQLLQILTPVLTSDQPIDRLWLHTQKGVARSLGLQQLSSAIHSLETALASEASLENARSEAHLVLQNYEAVARDLRGGSPDRDNSFLVICHNVVEGIKPQMKDHQLALECLTVRDHYQDWDEKKIERVRSILVHAIGNSIDHGFLRRGKTAAQLTIEASREAGDFVLKVQDNGAGINWQRLEQIAASRGWPKTDRLALQSLLFEDGVTTTEKVSSLSGRGVGLTAIEALCRQLQGQCVLGDAPTGSGTEMVARWPDWSWNQLSQQAV